MCVNIYYIFAYKWKKVALCLMCFSVQHRFGKVVVMAVIAVKLLNINTYL